MTTPRTPEVTQENDTAVRTTEARIGPPPLMKTWRRLYGLVIGVLVFDILVFWIVTKVFS